MFKRFKSSSARVWMLTGAMLGIFALPCPDCGTPMIFHVWPIAGLVLVARALKKRSQDKPPVISETGSSEQKRTHASAFHHEGHATDEPGTLTPTK